MTAVKEYNNAVSNFFQTPKPDNRPVPVPHGITVPPTQDDRWKYGLAAAIIVLLLLLLLLLFFKAGTNATQTGAANGGSPSTGAEQSETCPAEQNQAEPSAETDGATETIPSADSSVAESVDSVGTTDSGTSEEASPVVADTEAEPALASALDDLLRRLSAEPDDSTNSSQDDSGDRNQTGGDSLVKGDASVNFFGATGKGSKFVFVFDRSGSMSGQPLETVKRELIKSLEPLKSNHSFNVIAYDDQYVMWKNKLVSATKESKADAVRFIESISSRGFTEPRAPLLAAIAQQPEIIFFMTDGAFFLDVDEICYHGKKIVINVVQFGDGLPLPVLQNLANRTGGNFMLIGVRSLNDSL
jgi:hypothetical protein